MKISKLLVLGTMLLALCAALPVMAAEIAMNKTVSPATPNIYKVGDTIGYVLSVTNTSSEESMTIDIFDIEPGGSPTVQLENDLVLAPGAVWDYYTVHGHYYQYVVEQGDVVPAASGPTPWKVVNGIHALGTQGADEVDVTVTKTSWIQPPAIDIEKYVSVDDGVTWEDADAAPGPIATFPGTVKFKVVVTNTGGVDLTSVAVSDSDFTFTGVATSLAVGASDDSDVLSVASVVGQHENTADVSAFFGSTEVTDSDMAHYIVAPDPGIDIEKLVSVDGGATWDDADTATGPTAAVGADVKFKVVVTNTGNVDLTSVVVSDPDFIFLGVVGSLAVGASDESDVLTTTAVLGQHANTAGVSAYYETTEVTDSDMAHYIGSIDNPGIDIEKATNGEDADDPYGPFIMVGDTVTWTYVVTNTGTGDVPLTSVVVIDDNGTPLDDTDDIYPTYISGDGGVIGVLEVGEIWLYEATGTAAAGQYENIACVDALYEQVSVGDCDPSHYYGVVCYSETAFGWLNETDSECFLDLGLKLKNWGWTNGLLTKDTSYVLELWAGAGQCDKDNGTYAGTVSITYNGSGVDIVYDLVDDPEFEIIEEHVYVGTTPVPYVMKGKKSVPTDAPGQYTVTPGLTSFYLIYHAVVQWCELPEINGGAY